MQMYKRTINELNISFKRENIDSGYESLFKNELKNQLPNQFHAFEDIKERVKNRRIHYLITRVAFMQFKLPYFLAMICVLIDFKDANIAPKTLA